MIRLLQRFIRTYVRPVSLSALAKDPAAMNAAKTLVTYFYYILPYLAYRFVMKEFAGRENFDPLWPLAWVDTFSFDVTAAAAVIEIFFVVAAVSAVFLHAHRWVRFLVFVAVWQAHALQSSFGHVDHLLYTWLYVSLVLVFLPDVWRYAVSSFEKNWKFLLTIWAAQATVMLTYTMAGIQKFKAVYIQYMAGEIHGLSMMAFAYQSADWVRQLQVHAPLASSIIQHPEWWWLPYVGLYFVQLFAIWTMVRTSLQKMWALIFVLFHTGTYLSMGISFEAQLLLIIVLFFNTPFAPHRSTFKQIFFDLPVIGQVAEFIQRKRGKFVPH